MKVEVDAAGLIAVRDALIDRDMDEAYHQLYALACPDFSRPQPWAAWEAAAGSECHTAEMMEADYRDLANQDPEVLAGGPGHNVR